MGASSGSAGGIQAREYHGGLQRSPDRCGLGEGLDLIKKNGHSFYMGNGS
jgi:hypothetical protein